MKNNEELQTIINKLSDRLDFAENIAKLGYWEIDFANKKIFWSKEMFNIFGFTPDSLKFNRKIFREHVLEEDLDLYKEKLKRLLKKRIPIEGKLRIKTRHNTIKYCLFKANIIKENGVEKIAGIFQDISEFVLKQIELKSANQEAERINIAKSYFLAQASHDLRQPLQALSIFVAALHDEQLNDKQRNLVNKIKQSSTGLGELLNNLLDISKIESGGIEYNEVTFDIGVLIKRLYGELIDIADDKHIKLKQCNCHHIVKSDPFLIERILRNLVSNALKYCKTKVLIGCKSYRDKVRIFVIDDGVGISESDMEHLFDEFYQSKEIENNQAQGAGLGLSIVKKISTLIGADIKVISKPGYSSCFYFDLYRST